MINLDVKRNCQYFELVIDGENVNLSTGLLDDAEALHMARQLISAAEDLLPEDYADYMGDLVKVRECLDK